MRITAAGAATTDDVWRLYVTPQLWPTWAPQLRRVTCADRTVGPGTTGTAHGPAVLRIPFEVLAVDEVERTWVWRVGRPLGITLEHGVDEGADGGAVAWVDLPPWLLGYAPLARLALGRLVRA